MDKFYKIKSDDTTEKFKLDQIKSDDTTEKFKLNHKNVVNVKSFSISQDKYVDKRKVINKKLV